MNKDTSPPAFPSEGMSFYHIGITQRDWLAGLAMQSMIPYPEKINAPEGTSQAAIVAKMAFEFADAMIAEGKK